MLVDSFRFLPRSFVPLYEQASPLETEAEEVWAPFEARLAGASIALISSAGLSVEGEQPPFDLDRERREPGWGDPSFRVIPQDLGDRRLAMSHLHVNNADTLTDRNVSLPIDILGRLVDEGLVGAAAPSHFSVMGYQQQGLNDWRRSTAPAIIDILRSEAASGVILAPV